MEDEFPILSFYYEVEIDGTTISFQEVSGLETEVESVTYRHCDSDNFYPINIPGMVKHPPLVCKKGIVEDDEELLELMEEMIAEKEFYGHDDKFDISINLMNPEGEPVMSWTIEGAFPRKLSTPSLNASTNEIAFEVMEFTYDHLKASTDGA